MTYRLREVDGTEDEIADTLRDLHTVSFGSSAPQINPEEGYWWLAYLEKDVAGFCGLTPALNTPATGYLNRAAVLMGHRGHGLQRRMVRVREAKARKLGWVRMITDTTENPASSNNLIRCGYRLFAPQVPWAYPETIYWSKRL